MLDDRGGNAWQEEEEEEEDEEETRLLDVPVIAKRKVEERREQWAVFEAVD